MFFAKRTDEYSNDEFYNYSYEFSENKKFNDIFKKRLIDSIKSSLIPNLKETLIFYDKNSKDEENYDIA